MLRRRRSRLPCHALTERVCQLRRGPSRQGTGSNVRYQATPVVTADGRDGAKTRWLPVSKKATSSGRQHEAILRRRGPKRSDLAAGVPGRLCLVGQSGARGGGLCRATGSGRAWLRGRSAGGHRAPRVPPDGAAEAVHLRVPENRLHVQAYNMQRVMRVLGITEMMAAMRARAALARRALAKPAPSNSRATHAEQLSATAP